MICGIFERNIVKILTFFSVSPGSKLTRKEIQEKTLINNSPLDNSLTILTRNLILIKERRFYSLNFENDCAKEILKIIKKEHQRFKEIPLKVYFTLLDLSYKFSTMKNISSILLFGSYAKLIYTSKSDVDIAIILENYDKKQVPELKKIINRPGKKYSQIVEEHFFQKSDLKENDPLIKEIKRNGVKLF